MPESGEAASIYIPFLELYLKRNKLAHELSNRAKHVICRILYKELGILERMYYRSISIDPNPQEHHSIDFFQEKVLSKLNRSPTLMAMQRQLSRMDIEPEEHWLIYQLADPPSTLPLYRLKQITSASYKELWRKITSALFIILLNCVHYSLPTGLHGISAGKITQNYRPLCISRSVLDGLKARPLPGLESVLVPVM